MSALTALLLVLSILGALGGVAAVAAWLVDRLAPRTPPMARRTRRDVLPPPSVACRRDAFREFQS